MVFLNHVSARVMYNILHPFKKFRVIEMYIRHISRLLCAMAILSGARQSNAFNINSYCKQVAIAAGGSYQVEKICREQEYGAQRKISSKQIPSRIYNYCKEVGQAGGGSYQMMETCIQKGLEAKKSHH